MPQPLLFVNLAMNLVSKYLRLELEPKDLLTVAVIDNGLGLQAVNLPVDQLITIAKVECLLNQLERATHSILTKHIR